MQPPSYYTPNAKSNYHVLPQKNQHHNVGSYHPGFVPGSPRANFELYRIQDRPPSQHSNFQPTKHFNNYSMQEPKAHLYENPVKPLRNFMERNMLNNNVQEAPQTRFGEMKSSYMGPDCRQAAYIKQVVPNQNFRTPKKMPRPSEPYMFPENQLSQFVQKGVEVNNTSNFAKSKKEDPLNQSINSGISTASSKKLDPIQRVRMRKSSFDITDNWMKTIPKKKQKKWILNDFEKVNELGTGKYGKVFLVKQKQSQFLCALKIIEKQMLKQEEITQQFIRQLKIQTFLNHPNIIKMYGYFDDQTNIYIIMEVALGGQLYKYLKKNQQMGEPKIAIIMRQVVSAVNELHSNHIIHRDIKPQNIVLNQNIVKLCDFGWSVYHGQTLRSTFCGTPLYVSPQILKGNNYDEKIDIWSLGIMMYEMLTGENPFKITQEEELVKIIKDAVTFPSYLNISSEAKDFVMSCLQKNPNDRKNIRELMNHQFFKKYPEKVSKMSV